MIKLRPYPYGAAAYLAIFDSLYAACAGVDEQLYFGVAVRTVLQARDELHAYLWC